MEPLIQGKRLDDFIRSLEDLGLEPRLHHVMDPTRNQHGIMLSGNFYPFWELNEPANAEFVRKLDFEGIRRRRGDDWSPFK